MPLQFSFFLDTFNEEELKSSFQELIKDDKVQLQVMQFRGMDPTILVAIVASAGTALGAFISGILDIAKQKSIKTIIIQSKSGKRIEIHADKISVAEIDALLEKIEKMDGENLNILVP